MNSPAFLTLLMQPKAQSPRRDNEGSSHESS